MLQVDKPEDFVCATSKQYSVRQLVTVCFEMMGKKIVWRGEGVNEEGIEEASGKVLVQISPKYFRPTEVETLLGDPAKMKEKLGWVPETSFKALVLDMMRYDCQKVGIELPASADAIVERQDEYC